MTYISNKTPGGIMCQKAQVVGTGANYVTLKKI